MTLKIIRAATCLPTRHVRQFTGSHPCHSKWRRNSTAGQPPLCGCLNAGAKHANKSPISAGGDTELSDDR